MFRNKKIKYSLLFIIGLLIISLFFEGDGHHLATLVPFSPAKVPPFGTDQMGYSMLHLLLKGAKFTILIAVIAAFIRLVFSLIIGVGLTLFQNWFQNLISRLFSPFYYLPISLLTYLLLRTILMSQGYKATFSTTLGQRMIFELLLLSLIGVPTLLVYFKDITNQLLLEDHIMASRILGASPFRILRRNIWIGIKSRIIVQFVEQIIQVLVLLVHLGMFQLLFGGTIIYEFPMGQKPPIYSSISKEWSGMIGSGYHMLILFPWLAIDPLVAFAILIFAFSLLREGLKESQTNGVFVFKRNKPYQAEADTLKNKSLIKPEDFQPCLNADREVG